jgi:hypothetical protein
VFFNNPKAGGAQAWVDAEDNHYRMLYRPATFVGKILCKNTVRSGFMQPLI